MDKIFVGIRDSVVVNTLIIDNENIDLIQKIKDEFSYDFLVECNDNQVISGWAFDGVGVVPPKPHDSWVFNQETRQWETPIPYPIDGKSYQWDEDLKNWVELTPPTE